MHGAYVYVDTVPTYTYTHRKHVHTNTYAYIRKTCIYVHTYARVTYIHTDTHIPFLQAGRQEPTTTTTTTEPKPLCFCPVYSLLFFSFRLSCELFFSLPFERATNLPRKYQLYIAVLYLFRLSVVLATSSAGVGNEEAEIGAASGVGGRG
jgi:hypothetical protein